MRAVTGAVVGAELGSGVGAGTGVGVGVGLLVIRAWGSTARVRHHSEQLTRT